MNTQLKKYRALVIIIVLVALSGCSTGLRAQSSPEPLTIRTANGKEIAYLVEIADTDESRRRGLMYRREMPSNRGMLLDFEMPSKVSIWMKNTFLSLDIIYINADGEIAKIVTNATPLSTALMNSDTPVRAVLELNAGQVDYHGISRGDRVQHAAFNGQ